MAEGMSKHANIVILRNLGILEYLRYWACMHIHAPFKRNIRSTADSGQRSGVAWGVYLGGDPGLWKYGGCRALREYTTWIIDLGIPRRERRRGSCNICGLFIPVYQHIKKDEYT
jgi:hypothetical protein